MTEQEQFREILRGGYDLHTHSAPSHFARSITDFEQLDHADALQMAGLLIKCHYEPTALRAQLLNMLGRYRAKAYGGVTLNWPVGGINPYAAEAAGESGGKIVWLPTRDAAHSLTFGNMRGDFFERPGISVFDGEGKLLRSVYEVMDVCKKYNMHLATGHLHPRDSFKVCKAGREYGCSMIMTHPDWVRTVMPLEMQVELAKSGVLIEKAWSNVSMGYATIEQMAAGIREIGAENVFLITDIGVGMESFIAGLMEQGISAEACHTMVAETPKRIINE